MTDRVTSRRVEGTALSPSSKKTNKDHIYHITEKKGWLVVPLKTRKKQQKCNNYCRKVCTTYFHYCYNYYSYYWVSMKCTQFLTVND